ATMQYRSPEGVLFEGKGTVRAHALDAPPSQAPRIQIDYVGPGAGVARVEVSPKNVSVSSTGSASFVAKAYDDAGKVLTNVPLIWRTSDATAATIGPDGSLRGTGRRATLSVSASSPNGASDFASVALLPAAASIAVVSGNEQSGVAGQALAEPVVVEVRGADGLPVPGAEVSF